MRVPFYGFTKRFTSKGGKIETFILYYLLLSIVMHLSYNYYLVDKMQYSKYYHDDIVFTLFNLAILLMEFTNFMLIKFSGEGLEIFDVLLKFSDSIYEIIRQIIYNNKYSAFVFSNLTWTYIYIFSAIIIIVGLLKKFFRFTLSIAVVGLIIYVIYSTANTFILTNKYDDLDYISTEKFDVTKLSEVTVVDVVDGDTIKVMYENEVVTIRLLYIDTPEYTKEIEEYGFEASQALKSIISTSDKVYLEFDGDMHDKYGRVLAWVWCDDVLAQEILVKNGLVEDFYDYGNYKYEDIMHSALIYAKENNLNIYENE